MRWLLLVALLLFPLELFAQDDEAPPDDPMLDAPPPVAPNPVPEPVPAPAPSALPSAGIIGVAGRTVAGAVLVGRGGELYHRIDGAWRRKQGGGVATPLAAAAGPGPDSIWGVADAPPIYRHDGRTWLAETLPVTAGRAVLAPGPSPAILVGRRAVVRDANRWKPIRARGGANCELAAVAGDQILALCAGKLEHYDGRAWHDMPATLANGAVIVALAGGNRLHAITSVGGVLTVSGRRLQPLKPGAELSLTPALAAADSAGKLHVVAREGIGATATWQILAESSGVLAAHSTLPLTGDADLPTLFFIGSDGLLVVTASGKVFVRTADGTWKTEQVERALPAPPTAPKNPPARAG